MSDFEIRPSGDHETKLEAIRTFTYPSEQRRPDGVLSVVITIVCAALTILTLYSAFRLTFSPGVMRAGHLLIAIPLTFILYPAIKRGRQRSPSVLDWVLVFVSLAAFAWAIYSDERWQDRNWYFDPVEPLDMILGVAALVVIFEATRRTVGITIVMLTLFFMGYALTGPLWPGIFKHQAVTSRILIEHMYMVPDGLLNFLMGIMATFLFTFLAFGAFLKVSGGDKVFTDLALALAGHRRGGPAKVAVISSSLMGMLSGSTVSNVATTGALTIPMMKRMGFQPYEAAAIETTASLGGALMPPLMGAGVFIMASFTGVPLITILEYSVLPAVLYFSSIYFYVDIKSRKKGLEGLPREDLPNALSVLKQGGHIFLPLVVLIWLLVIDFTPYFASSACVLMVFAVSLLRRESRMTPSKLVIALEASARIAITITSLSASAALIYAVINVTGLMVKVTAIILSFSGGSVLLAIIFIVLMSYVLGMGMPVTASYVLIAVLGAPALGQLGLPMLTAHLIIFWFSQDSTITPPICMTAFVGARIADAPPMKTGLQCVLMAKALYILPFIFAYGNLLDVSLLEIFFDFAVLFCMFAFLPMVFEGYYDRKLTLLERGLAALAGVTFFISALGPMADSVPWLIAAAVLSSIVAVLKRKPIPGVEAAAVSGNRL